MVCIEKLKYLDGQHSILLLASAEKIQETVLDVVKYLTQEGAGIFISLNKPYKALVQALDNRGVEREKLFFIDCITVSSANTEYRENVSYIENPSKLTGISIAVEKFVKSPPKKEFIFLDNLQTFLIYNTPDMVARFIRSIIALSARSNLNVVISTSGTKNENLTKNIMPFFDKVVWTRPEQRVT